MIVDLAAEEADIIHAYNIHAVPVVLAYFASRSSHTRFLVSPYYHGNTGHTPLANLFWIPYRPLIQQILRRVDGIIVNSSIQQQRLTEVFRVTGPFYTVYDGVELGHEQGTPAFKIDPDQRIILYVGRLERYKNIHVAIEALSLLPSHFKFIVIGLGSFRSQLEAYARTLNVHDRVCFLGYLPDDEVRRWMQVADVFIHLSRVESFGMSCIEALASGTRVIANDDGFGLTETIHLFPDFISSYKVGREPLSKLTRLMMMQSTHITPDLSCFAWENITDHTLTIYRQALAKKDYNRISSSFPSPSFRRLIK
jgi:glycosyltransferase involved in cell wall biosynthesis